MTNEQLREALALLASQQKKLIEKPKRDFWDKFSIFAPLITGLVITGTSLYITDKIQSAQKVAADRKEGTEKAAAALKAEADRKASEVARKLHEETAAREKEYQLRLARTELLNKFIPYLAGKDEEVSMAIVAISITGDSELMDAVARMTPGKGVQSGLALVASKGPTEEIRTRASATLNLIETVSRAVPTKGIQTLGERALEIALGELKRGVKEEPPDSNRGERIDVYNRAAGFSESGIPWSGSFVFWCYTQALKKGTTLPVKLSASWRATEHSLKEAGRWKPQGSGYEPKPGDLAIFEWTTDSFHGGIVAGVDGDKVYTIEGNTSPDDKSRNGDSVAGKVSTKNRVKGYGDMNFD